MALGENEKNNVLEILNNAVPGGASMLSELLGKDTSISLSQVDSIEAAAVGSMFPGKNLVAPSELGDGLGSTAVVISEAQAAIMADLMIGQDGSNPPAALEDLHLSAVTELTNQVVDSVLGSVSSQVGVTLMANPGEVSVADLDAGVIPGMDGEVVVMEAELKIGEFDAGKLGLVFAGDIASRLKSGAQADASASADGFVNDATAGASQGQQATPSAQNVVTSELATEKHTSVYDSSLDIVMDVPLQVTVELGRTNKLVREVLEMTPGSVIELDKLAGEPVDILVNQKYIAKGEVVVIDENFGIRITDIIRPAERIPKI